MIPTLSSIDGQFLYIATLFKNNANLMISKLLTAMIIFTIQRCKKLVHATMIPCLVGSYVIKETSLFLRKVGCNEKSLDNVNNVLR